MTATVNGIKLKVRVHRWQPDGGPRVEYWDGKRWVACRSIGEARAVAERRGYAGIQVKPV